ncbi:YopX family protein [Facklamia sp. P13064]|uniref:YopX family protein n=1 Tax=Facklamia sp. P13064 TaxID=3421953 RepID=UPI003D180EEC
MLPKFRAWDKATNKMRGCYGFNEMENEVYVSSVANDEFNGRLRTVHAVKCRPDEVVLMQSTFLKDKNGTDIFVGDIIKTDSTQGVVLYDVLEGLYHINGDPLQYFVSETNSNNSQTEIQVIGNIYKNPELLED